MSKSPMSAENAMSSVLGRTSKNSKFMKNSSQNSWISWCNAWGAQIQHTWFLDLSCEFQCIAISIHQTQGGRRAWTNAMASYQGHTAPTALVWLFGCFDSVNIHETQRLYPTTKKKGCIQVCRFNLGLWQEEGNIFCLAKLVSQTNVSTIFSVFPNVTMQLWKAAASQKTMAGNILSTTSFFQNESTDWQCSPQRPFLQHWQLIRHHWPVKGFPERDTMRKTKQVIQTKHVPVPVLLSHAKNSRLTIHNLCKSAIHLDSVYLGVWPSNFNVYCPIKYTPSGSQWIVRFALCQNSLRCCYCWLVNLRHPTSLELLSTNNTSGNNQSPTQASVA